MAEEPKKPRKVSLPVTGAGKPMTFLEKAEIGDDAVSGDRPPAAWIGLGAMATFAFMVPLAMGAMSLLKSFYAHAPGGRPNPVPLYVLSFLVPAVSAAAGGFLVGRFGPKMGAKGGLFSGLIAGIGMFAIAASGEVREGRGWLSALSALVIVIVTTPAGWLGGRLGKMGRKAR